MRKNLSEKELAQMEAFAQRRRNNPSAGVTESRLADDVLLLAPLTRELLFPVKGKPNGSPNNAERIALLNIQGRIRVERLEDLSKRMLCDLLRVVWNESRVGLGQPEVYDV